jgi:hypothetical protein
MGHFSEMMSKVLNPDVRLPVKPNRIRPVTTTPAIGWGPAPTGYYPDHWAATMGQVRDDFPVTEAHGSPGGARVPVEPLNAAQKVDQHPIVQVSATWTPAPSGLNGRRDGRHDPLPDGLPEPVIRLFGTWWYPRSGTSRTRYMDVPDGRAFPATGSQDGQSWTYFVDQAIATAPYAPVIPYDPENPEGTGQNADSLRALPPSPAHGYSEIPVASGVKVQAGKRTSIKGQQQYVGQNRLANSTYAGQTYSQQTSHVANPAGASGMVEDPWRDRG